MGFVVFVCSLQRNIQSKDFITGFIMVLKMKMDCMGHTTKTYRQTVYLDSVLHFMKLKKICAIRRWVIQSSGDSAI